MRLLLQFRQPICAYALSLSWLLAPAAQAQLSGSAGLLSNYMYRGVSFSADKPAARLALNYDDAGGWFAGGQVVTGQLAVQQHRSAQWVGYAGYAQRLPSGLAWEGGVSAYAFPRASGWSYREVYAGLSAGALSGRLHYAPDYLGLGERTLYGELNGGWMVAPHVQAFWHGGYLHSYDNARSRRADGRLGLTLVHRGWQAQVSLDVARLRGASAAATANPAVTPAGMYPADAPAAVALPAAGVDWRHKIVLSVSRFF